MVNLNHAKKAQALASDLDYRKKLHDYTILPDDIKVQQAKKAYNLQSDVRKSRSKHRITRTVFFIIIIIALFEPAIWFDPNRTSTALI